MESRVRACCGDCDVHAHLPLMFRRDLSPLGPRWSSFKGREEERGMPVPVAREVAGQVKVDSEGSVFALFTRDSDAWR